MRERQSITTESVTAAVLGDHLVPEEVYYPIHGGRSSFQKFEEEGLPIHIQNRRRCVRPSELKAFIDRRATVKNPEAAKEILALCAPKRANS